MLQHLFDENAAKKASNLSVNSDLLSKARELNINLSATLEHALEDRLRKTARANWREENKGAIAALNGLVDKNGLFSDSYRCF